MGVSEHAPDQVRTSRPDELAQPPTAPPSVPPGGRALAPDLARGVMLLLIAVANVTWYLWGSTPATTTLHPAGDRGLDLAATLVTLVVVDMRVYPMFAFLFGYGMVQFARSRQRRGIPERGVRAMLRRRHVAMIGIGALHAALLWFGDVVAAYGLIGLLAVWLFFRRRTRTLLIWAGLGVVALALLLTSAIYGAGAIDALPPGDPALAGQPTGTQVWTESTAVNAMTSYAASIPARLAAWVPLALAQGVLLPIIPVTVLLAWAAARHEVLERPDRHRRLLWVVAVGGIGIGLAGGLYAAGGYLDLLGLSPHAWWLVMTVAMVTGLPGGLGYVAAFALIAERIGRRARAQGRPAGSVPAAIDPLVQVGRRSLTCYLGQSVLFAPLLCGWGLGLGGSLGSAAAFGLAVLVWLLTVAFATWLGRTGRQGPAEVVLRRLTYGRVGPAASGSTG